MKVLAVIPVRMSSTRLPRKPLMMIQGKSLLRWAVEAAREAFDEVIVATPDEELVDDILDTLHLDWRAELVPKNLRNGSEASACVSKRHPEFEIVVNVQADRPFIKPADLSLLVQAMKQDENRDIAALVAPLNPADFHNPNKVKVVWDKDRNALYYSRAAIPHNAKLHFQSAGVYAYRKRYLQEYAEQKPGPLEKAEGLEQLRAIEQGKKILVVPMAEEVLSVDTPEDLEHARSKEKPVEEPV